MTTLWYEAEEGGAVFFPQNGGKAEGSVASETLTTEQGHLRLVMDGGRVRLDEDGRALFRLGTNPDLRELAVAASSTDLTGKWYDTTGDLGAEQLVTPADEEVVDFDNPKHALVEMGFSEGDISAALRRSQRWGGGLLEAANFLAEQQKSSWSSISGLVNLFGKSASSGLTETYKPGKYKILVDQTASSSATDGGPAGPVAKGDVVDLEELHFPTVEGGWIRGRMEDGRWISIYSEVDKRSCIWAKPLSVEAQLLDLGFPADKAREAARRCSSVEAAVEFLASNLD